MWRTIVLVFWCLWRHGNGMVFKGVTSAVGAVKTRIKEGYERWRLANLFRVEGFGFPEPIPIW
jgi:hypothetical protein